MRQPPFTFSLGGIPQTENRTEDRTEVDRDPLVRKFRELGLDSYIDSFAPVQDAPQWWRDKIKLVSESARSHPDAPDDTLDEASLLSLCDRNPVAARTVLQTIRFGLSPLMTIAVIRMLHGMDIVSFDAGYQRGGRGGVRLELASGHDRREVYETDHVGDLFIVRHLAKTGVGSSVELTGAYPFRDL